MRQQLMLENKFKRPFRERGMFRVSRHIISKLGQNLARAVYNDLRELIPNSGQTLTHKIMCIRSLCIEVDLVELL